MRKRVLITGCSGFIGSHLAKRLSEKYDIIGIDKEPMRDGTNAYVVGFKQIDITKNIFDFSDIYAVIHLAARAGVRGSQTEYEQYVNDNIIGTKNLLDACVRSIKPEKILLASSSSVYGDSKTKMKESHKPKPKSLYAATKLAMEDIAATYDNNNLLKSTICNMRIFTVYGPAQREELAISNFIVNALMDYPITVFGTGKQTRAFTYATDFCNIVDGLLSKNRIPKILNTGFEGSHSVNEVIRIISEYLDKRLVVNREKKNRYDVMSTNPDTSLLKRTLPDIKREVEFRDGIINQIEWTKRNLGLE